MFEKSLNLEIISLCIKLVPIASRPVGKDISKKGISEAWHSEEERLSVFVNTRPWDRGRHNDGNDRREVK